MSEDDCRRIIEHLDKLHAETMRMLDEICISLGVVIDKLNHVDIKSDAVQLAEWSGDDSPLV